MKTTPHPTHQEPVVQSNQPSTRRLVRSGALAGAIAAVCTTVVAAIASAADVSLEIDAKAIPIPAFRVVDPRRCRPGRRVGPTPSRAPTVRRRHHSRRRPVAHPSDRSSRRHRHQSRSRGDPPPRGGHHHPDSQPAAPRSTTTADREALNEITVDADPAMTIASSWRYAAIWARSVSISFLGAQSRRSATRRAQIGRRDSPRLDGRRTDSAASHAGRPGRHRPRCSSQGRRRAV